MAKEEPRVQMRLSPPKTLHKKIVAYQKLRSIGTDEDISLREAAYELWQKALDSIPAIKEVA